MSKIKIYTVSFLSFLIIFSVQARSQEKTMISPYIQLQYYKTTDDQRILQTTLTFSKNRMELPLGGMEIFYFSGGNNKEPFAKVVTDDKGIARLEISNDLKLSENSDGLWEFSSGYKGNDTIEAAAAELSIKDVKLEMTLTEPDSIKTITISAAVSENGKNKPVSGEVVKIYVPRMFSLLPVGEVTLDETGTASMEFPSDLPGDKNGSLTIIAKFEEHPLFGNVERRTIREWGVPTHYTSPGTHRALWTKTAPRWMIYTLSILLAGVWGHYLFAVISLILIRIDAKRKAAKEEYKI